MQQIFLKCLPKKAHFQLKTFAKQNHHFLLIKMSICKLPKMKQYKLIIRNGKISCCNSCLNELNRENLKLCIIGRNVYDWHVNVHKQENTRIYKLGRQNWYYCTRKQRILASRPFLDIAEIDIITKEKERIGRVHINWLQAYFSALIKDS